MHRIFALLYGLLVLLALPAVYERFGTFDAAGQPVAATIAERYVTARDEAVDVGAITTHRGPWFSTWILATVDGGNAIRIYDAASGRAVQNFGRAGRGAGEFRGAVGIVASQRLLFVVERDNARVQVLRLPDLVPLAAFGERVLSAPSGAYLETHSGYRYTLYVPDGAQPGNRSVGAADAQNKVHVWSLDLDRSRWRVHARYAGALEDAAVSDLSAVGGSSLSPLLTIDGARDAESLRAYKPRHESVTSSGGVSGGPPIAVALYDCPDGTGYWITTRPAGKGDVFNLFERRSLRYAGAFRGRSTRRTRSIAASRRPIRGFADGVVFAVYDDRGVVAFDWRAIRDALDLRVCSVD